MRYLTEAEVEKLIAAAEKLGRHGHRDGTMLMVAYRHALRVSELVSLKWDQVQFKEGLLHVRRLKNGTPSTHPLCRREMPRSPRTRERQPTPERKANRAASTWWGFRST
ncbi:MAG: tyrosine-type recombinase/integrase [Verrucomicrobia bacterium]|nr:tyrosine-type recombinase/integrase [Verrucomicrobiota bacterium]